MFQNTANTFGWSIRIIWEQVKSKTKLSVTLWLERRIEFEVKIFLFKKCRPRATNMRLFAKIDYQPWTRSSFYATLNSSAVIDHKIRFVSI